MTTHEHTTGKKTYCVWADCITRVYQEVEAESPRRAFEIARDEPDGWQNCSEFIDRDDYRLCTHVQDTETGAFTYLGPRRTCKTCNCDIVETVNDGRFGDGECGSCEYERYKRGSDPPKESNPAPAPKAIAAAPKRPANTQDDRTEDWKLFSERESLVVVNDDGRVVCEVYHHDKRTVNAHLIAAAPELRRALRALLARVKVPSAPGGRGHHGQLAQAVVEAECACELADGIGPGSGIRTRENSPGLPNYWPQSLASDRNSVEMRERLCRYFALNAQAKIRLAMAILWDVCENWDHDRLEHYPAHLPSFDEYLTVIGNDLYEITWTPPDSVPPGTDVRAA